MSSDVVVQADRLSKVYRLYDAPSDRLKEMVLGRFGRRYGRDFAALHDVSFSLQRGERLGVIGRNGSGKSTLLQILAGTLQPTSGSVSVSGRVAALLELGSGFNPDYTGRENIYLNASILGLSSDQIDARFDAIAAFADIGRFLDQPVKTYSSGMFVRLAFAVTTSVDADVLLVDEALAVGDVFFTQKCFRHLHGLVERGVAIVLVTHDTTAVSQFCTSALLLDGGHVRHHGDTITGIRRYFALQREVPAAVVTVDRAAVSEDTRLVHAEPWPDATALLPLDGVTEIGVGARCTAVALCDESGRATRTFEVGAIARIYFEFELTSDIGMPIVGLEMFNSRAIVVHGRNTLQEGVPGPSAVPGHTRIRGCRRIRLDVAPDEYTFAIGVAWIAAADAEMSGTMSYDVLAERIQTLLVVKDAGALVVQPRSQGQALPFHGLCNLEGQTSVWTTGADIGSVPAPTDPRVETKEQPGA